MTFLYHDFSSKFSRDRSFNFHGDLFFETKWRGCEFFMNIIWLSCTWTKFCPKHFSIKASGRLIDWLVVFNIIFNTQWLYIWWSVLLAEWSEWSTDLRRVTDKLYHIKYGRRCITVIWIVYKNLSNELRKQIWLGQKSAKWNQIEHALGRKI